MKRYFKYIILFVAISAACVGCSGNEPTPPPGPSNNFSKQTAEGVYNDNRALFAFDKYVHQIAVNPQDRTYRIQTDMQEKYVHCLMSAMPTVANADISVTAYSEGIDGMTQQANFSTKVQKVENNKAWLWDEQNKIGFIVRLEP